MNTQDFYNDNGYVVFQKLIPTNLIDRLLNLYTKEIVPSDYPFYRQSKMNYEVNDLNEFGFVKQSFLDIHDYKKFPEFSNIAKEIYCGNLIQNALEQITGSQSFNLMQTMFFDANTETPAHQDWWYLDTVPNGHLIGAWIALEDIDERAGRFYVVPKSIKNFDFHSDTPNLSHSEWLIRLKEFVEANKDNITAPPLKKGDVLFWNSKTIHGALPTQDNSFSRKSLTAHYIPSEYQFGNLFTTKDYIAYKSYNGMKFYRTQGEYSLRGVVKSKIRNFVYDSSVFMSFIRKLQSGMLKLFTEKGNREIS